jgi:ATP-binding cassette subfamily B protein
LEPFFGKATFIIRLKSVKGPVPADAGRDPRGSSLVWRQRIAIARAFLKNAPILLLDEATSALDSDSEEAIREALGRLMQGRTVIAIAHRLSTLRSFDRIVVLQEGRAVQDGAPDHLIRRDGLYRELVMREMNRLSKQAA